MKTTTQTTTQTTAGTMTDSAVRFMLLEAEPRNDPETITVCQWALAGGVVARKSLQAQLKAQLQEMCFPGQ